MLESLFTLEALGGAAKSLITSILSGKLKAKLSSLSQTTLDALFEKAANQCSIELKPEKREALRQAFRQSKVNDQVLAFQESRILIKDAFFVELFEPIVGKQHAEQLASDLFTQLRKLIAKEQPLQNEISSLYSEIILDLLQKQMAVLQQTGEDVASIKATVGRLEALLEKRSDIAGSIGSTEIAPLPIDFVRPETTLAQVKQSNKRVVLLYGPPGAGKSVSVATLARAAQEQKQLVFWYRFRPLLDDHNSVQKKLTAFLQAELHSDETSLSLLLQQSRALLVFDDLHYVADEKLQQLLKTIAAIVAESANCRLLLTSRGQSGFLPANLKALNIAGLSETETEQLLCQTWKMDLTPKQLANAKTLFKGNPQFLIYFHEWQQGKEADAAQLDAYFKKAFDTDETLHHYLMQELYEALGGADSDLNKLLKAVAFYRVPQSKAFIEQLHGNLGGQNFTDTFYDLHNRRRLLSRLPDSDLYDLHDLLRQFYYDCTEKRIAVHKFTAELYHTQSQQSREIVDFIESGHHFAKANMFEAAAKQMQPVTHYCMVRGLYWQILADVLAKLKMPEIADSDLRAEALYDRGNLKRGMGKWQDALMDLNACLDAKPEHHGALNSIGLVYQDKGEWDKALEYYHKSLSGQEQVGDVHGMAQTYGNMSLLAFERKESEEAIRIHLAILLLFTKLGAAPPVAQARSVLGSFHQKMDAAEFERISQVVLEEMFTEGVKWGRHQVVTPAEAQAMLQQD